MALAYSVVKRTVTGNVRQNIVDITMDGSYAGGGYTPSAASMGVGTIHTMQACNAGTGTVWTYEPSTGKIKGWKSNGTSKFQEAAAGDISASDIIRFVVYGDAPTG